MEQWLQSQFQLLPRITSFHLLLLVFMFSCFVLLGFFSFVFFKGEKCPIKKKALLGFQDYSLSVVGVHALY